MLEQLTAARNHYLEGYAKAVQNRQDHTPEVGMQVGDDAPEPYNLYRFDLVSFDGDEPSLVEVNLESYIESEPMIYQVGDMAVEIQSLHWNGIEFSVQPAIVDEEPLKVWAIRWLDLEEDLDLGGFIHSLTAPEDDRGYTMWSVDFGTAPVQAVQELLQVLAGLGVKSVKLHSETMID